MIRSPPCPQRPGRPRLSAAVELNTAPPQDSQPQLDTLSFLHVTFLMMR
jgi:hypothetical protein